jgi:phospholipid-binding lipoprotein MlaA
MRAVAALLVAWLVSGCAATSDRADAYDPWEGLNRKTFAFNDALDKAVMKPLAQGYQKVTPGFMQEGVNNFFGNLDDVGTSLNNFLQGKATEGASDAGRFVVNTVLGVFGLWDVATPLGLEKHDEDFGQTLGAWGVAPGPYFVIPLLGPSTARDAPARFVDPQWFVWPRAVDNEALYWSIWGFDKVRIRANLLKAEKVIDEASLDKYSFIRDAWWQRRRNQVYDGSPPREKDEEEPAR